MFSRGKTCKFRRTLYNRQLIQFVRIPAEFVARLNLVFSTANRVMSCEIYLQFLAHISLGTSGFPRVRREFSVSVKARHIFGRRPKPRAAKRVTIKTWHKDLTETGNRARKVSATQGRPTSPRSTIYLFILFSSFFEPILDPRFSIPILDPRPWLSSKLRSFTH